MARSGIQFYVGLAVEILVTPRRQLNQIHVVSQEPDEIRICEDSTPISYLGLSCMEAR